MDSLGTYGVVVVGDERTGEPDVVRVYHDRVQFLRCAADSPVAERQDMVFRTLERCLQR